MGPEQDPRPHQYSPAEGSHHWTLLAQWRPGSCMMNTCIVGSALMVVDIHTHMYICIPILLQDVMPMSDLGTYVAGPHSAPGLHFTFLSIISLS